MPCTVMQTVLPDMLVLELKIYGNNNNFFISSFNQRYPRQAIGMNGNFVQDHRSKSTQGVMHSLHYQIQQPQGKLVLTTQDALLNVPVENSRLASKNATAVFTERRGVL